MGTVLPQLSSGYSQVAMYSTLDATGGCSEAAKPLKVFTRPYRQATSPPIAVPRGVHGGHLGVGLAETSPSVLPVKLGMVATLRWSPLYWVKEVTQSVDYG